MVRIAFDVAGAGPGGQLFRVALVKILRDGVEIVHLLLAVARQLRSGRRARHALFAARLMRVLDRADGGHGSLQVGHKRRRQGVIRPSTPMSPTCTLLGMPPRAMTAQFSNSNGGMTRSF